MYIGAHVSIAGGIQNATERAAHLEINTMQIFTKNQRQWFSSKLKEDEIDEYLENVKVYDMRKVFSHASYLLNLSSNDKILLEKSQRSFLDEINRSEILNLIGVVFHPGTYAGRKIDEAIQICADSINMIIDNTRKYTSKLILETTAGQGKSLGYNFEQIRAIVDKVERKSRVGVCLDTSHIFAAGYNIRTDKGYKKTMDAFDDIIGFKHLDVIHLNNSAKPLGSRVDRHANLQSGMISKDFYHNILKDKQFKKIPFILETPGEMAGYQKDLEFVKKITHTSKHLF